jgi:hypothetical protein
MRVRKARPAQVLKACLLAKRRRKARARAKESASEAGRKRRNARLGLAERATMTNAAIEACLSRQMWEWPK